MRTTAGEPGAWNSATTGKLTNATRSDAYPAVGWPDSPENNIIYRLLLSVIFGHERLIGRTLPMRAPKHFKASSGPRTDGAHAQAAIVVENAGLQAVGAVICC